jgi:ABC-type antimicrobial peptide transport system permease subunit
VALVRESDADRPVTGAQPPGEAGAGSVWRLIWNVFFQNRLAVVGLGIIAFMILFCFVGPLIYHTNQVQIDIMQVTQPPSARAADAGRPVLA